MKILLHVCCAPCSIYPFEELMKTPDNKVAGFYFNPNIYPAEEYQKRRTAIETYAAKEGFEIICPEYEPGRFAKSIAGNEERPARCKVCWQLRLEETASFAKAKGFDAFTTTLLISPYQDHVAIRSIGESISKRLGIRFYYLDFRDGFKHSQEEARKQGMYMQKYCGCRYSLVESETQKHSRKK